MSQSFLGLGVSPTVAGALERLGITTPFPVQSLVLTDALAGRDVIAAAPTGSGKTLAFGIPVVERARARATRRRRSFSSPPASSQSRSQTTSGRSLVRATSRSQPFTAAIRSASRRSAPRPPRSSSRRRAGSRICSTAGSSISARSAPSSSTRPTGCSTWASGPQVERILKTVPTLRQTLLFSATLEGAVADLARTYTADPVTINASQPVHAASAEIEHVFVSVTADDKINKLVERIDEASGLSLVFVRTKHGADRLARKLLRSHDIRTAVLHGNMSQNARQRSLEMFESGRAMTLVATDVAARGIDVDDISHVINFDPAAVGRRLRAPRRPHRPCRPKRHRGHPGASRAAPRRRDARTSGSGMTRRSPPPACPWARRSSSRQASSTRRRGRRR